VAAESGEGGKMSVGQFAFECPTCGDATARRGECLSCATQRREAALWAQGKAAEIWVRNRVEMPQHVEPLTPIATREVVGIRVAPLPKAPEKPARAPKVAEPKQDRGEPAERAIRAPRARKEAPPPHPKAPKLTRDTMALDPEAPPGRCRVKGCERPRRCRGLCDSCRHAGRVDLMLPSSRPEREEARADLRLRILALVEQQPGITPLQIGQALGREKPEIAGQLLIMRKMGQVVADHRGTYRAPSAPVPVPVTNTDRVLVVLREVGRPVQPHVVQARLGLTDPSMRAALKRLRMDGKINRGKKGLYKDCIWLA
jgi:DNA-binding transcriptional ArsR family regulator